MDLRERIARAIFDDDKNFDAMPREYHETSLYKATDRILALPEIREALEAEAYIRERRGSIRRGARRTDHRFSPKPALD